MCLILQTQTLSLQENAVENVKLAFSGEAAQTMKHLLANHVIQRTAMACISNAIHENQLLAIAHDKSKV